MAWNGSKEMATHGAVPKKSGPDFKQRHCIFLWYLIGVGIGVSVLVLYLSYSGKEPVSDRVQTNDVPRIIQDVRPTRLDNNTEAEAQPTDDGEWRPPKNAYKDERGIWRHPGGHRVYNPTRLGKSANLRMVGDKPSIFRYRSEREIERLLTLEPGRTMFGTRRYDVRFEEDFQKSLEEPIIISADDSEEDKVIKRAMIDAKVEIMERIRAGERLGDILDETRSELQRMAQYKRNLNKELVELSKRDGEISDANFNDYIDAANKMLKDNGIAPIKNTGLIKKNLRIQSRRTNK